MNGCHEQLTLTLYVTGRSPRSLTAQAAVTRLCERYLSGLYTLRVVDIAEQPQSAEDAKVLATPTLVREAPLPIMRFIGSLDDESALWSALGHGLAASRAP